MDTQKMLVGGAAAVVALAATYYMFKGSNSTDEKNDDQHDAPAEVGADQKAKEDVSPAEGVEAEETKSANIAPASDELIKLFVHSAYQYWALIVSNFTNSNVEVKIIDPKAKQTTLSVPYIETVDGDIISENSAIAAYIASLNPGAQLTGSNVFEDAQVNQWVAWTDGISFVVKQVSGAIYGDRKNIDFKQYEQNLDEVRTHAKTLDQALEGKTWIVGDRVTLADIACGVVLTPAFQLVLDQKFRASVPNLAKWFERWTSLPEVTKSTGRIQSCEFAIRPLGAPEEEIVEVKPADDDLDDLFGDDDEDAEAAAAVAKAAAQKSKKPKKVVIAMSIVMLEVKPLDDTINLDDVAARIFAEIQQDGLFWKTEYKKEPVAFGIFKLIVGFSLEDEKVSVDDVVEKIEEFADMVQSVEIATFNKI